MASQSAAGSKPKPIQTKSFSRLESSGPTSPFFRNRATTIQNGVVPKIVTPFPMSPQDPSTQGKDIFEERPSLDETDGENSDLEPSLSRSQSLPERFDELPIELISLTDRFIESLATKKYSAPLTIDGLSDVFQDFYIRAASHIATHISALSSRLNRESSPAPSRSSHSSGTTKPSQGTKQRKDTADSPEKTIPDQQMLTASEVAERRKARRMLEFKRVALEDAVERRACEMVYDKIWRHRSTLDEVEDEKLRSKTAALSLVGIGLKDLGIELEEDGEKEHGLYDLLGRARKSLARMGEDKFPLGKLRHLTAAHKAIVDALSNIHQSSSSADEILPTLIYTLITSPVEGINIVSNMNFVQRFRTRSKIDGEAAYCLTNLEAAISFLDNVDLSSLRVDEAPEGPPKNPSRPDTPTSEKPDMFKMENKLLPAVPSPSSGSSATATTELTAQASLLKSTSQSSLSKPSTPTSGTHQRRLSQLLQPPAKAFGAANDAVRNTADQGFKNISNTLDNSFKFLFGRLNEEILNRAGQDANRNVVVPKTLDEARRLVNPPQVSDDASNMSDTSSLAETLELPNDSQGPKVEDKVLGFIGGRKQTRERSVDSVKSSGSGKKVAFAGRSPLQDSISSHESDVSASPPNVPTVAHPNAAVDTMRNIGNTLNPLNLGMNVFRGFGRNVVETPPALAAETEKSKELGASMPKQPPMATGKATEIPKIKPPNQRYLDVKDPSELKIGEVSELLKDYQRLAIALKDLGSF